MIAADVYFGHGTDNAGDEALFLTLHALGLSYEVSEVELCADLTAVQLGAIDLLVNERIESRRPAAYITGYTWFCGHRFQTDERVLVPRSPFAELIVKGFHPWCSGGKSAYALEIGTGGGCIAIAMALMSESLKIDATDISPDAISMARENASLHFVSERVRFHEVDLFPLKKRAYDLIVANPPYVPSAVHAELPREYHCEPVGALVSGSDGMDCVRRILRKASRYLSENGVLFMEVGEIWSAVEASFPRLDFTWIDLECGGEGVFVVTREQLLMSENHDR